MTWGSFFRDTRDVSNEFTNGLGKGVLDIDERKPVEPQGQYKDLVASNKQIDLDKRISEQDTGIKEKVSEINGYKYVQDKFGRTICAKGELKLKPETGRNKKLQKEAGGKDRLKTDDGGHLIGRQFGGVGEKNLVAQDKLLNKGPYNRLENKWANALKNGDRVYVKIEPIYIGNSSRPDSFRVSYKINGEKFKTTFSNQPNAYAK